MQDHILKNLPQADQGSMTDVLQKKNLMENLAHLRANLKMREPSMRRPQDLVTAEKVDDDEMID